MRNFLMSRGFDSGDMVVLTDDQNVDPRSPSYPSGSNIMRAFQWLVHNSENHSLFLHYSGHGGQTRDEQNGGIDDTICPVDFAEHGQINSDILHQALVSRMPPNAQLHAVFDCCHSGTVMELPFTYRTDEDGNVGMVDNIKQGIQLATGAAHLLQGGFNTNSLRDAEQLYAGASSFFKGLQHMGEDQGPAGIGQAEGDYANEAGHRVIMYSGCKDDQTSADASISGSHVGAMSWAFLETMRNNNGQQSYVDILRNTRGLLQQNYSQIPQLSCGQQINLDEPFMI